MAYTKVFAIRRRLDDRVKYAVNGEKTELDAGIAYAVNPEKTEQVRFVDVLNCASAEAAFETMRATKRKFKKMGLFWHSRGSKNGVSPVFTRHGGFRTFC